MLYLKQPFRRPVLPVRCGFVCVSLQIQGGGSGSKVRRDERPSSQVQSKPPDGRVGAHGLMRRPDCQHRVGACVHGMLRARVAPRAPSLQESPEASRVPRSCPPSPRSAPRGAAPRASNRADLRRAPAGTATPVTLPTSSTPESNGIRRQSTPLCRMARRAAPRTLSIRTKDSSTAWISG